MAASTSRVQAINLLAHKANCWDYVTRRGYVTPRQIEEAREFAKAATTRRKK